MNSRAAKEHSQSSSDGASIGEAVWAILRSPQPDPPSDEYLRGVQDLQARVERAARRLVGRKFELADVVQEALESTIRYARLRPHPPKSLDGFLHYRVLHVLKRLLRAPPPQDSLDEDQILALADVIVRPTAALEEEEQRRALAECLEALTEARAAVWDRIYHAMMDDRTAARDLGITVNAFRVRLHHARVAVADCLEQKGVLEP